MLAALASVDRPSSTSAFPDPTDTRVSVSTAAVEGNDHSFQPSISGDGRFVAFNSGATNLVAGDTNAINDIFVRDRTSGTTERVSVSSAGAQGENGGPGFPSISANGRFVSFNGYNWPGDPIPPGARIYVRDRTAGTTEQVSLSSGGAQADGYSNESAISADGRYVAFGSSGTNLVPGDTNGVEDIFVRDRKTGTTARVSVSSAGAQATGASAYPAHPAISANGRFVAFKSAATDLVAGDTNGADDVFWHDRDTNANGIYDEPGFVETRMMSQSTGSVQGNAASDKPSISASGLFVAFRSAATNLVVGDTNATTDIFVRDIAAGSTVRVSVDNGGSEGNAGSGGSITGRGPSISGDGRLVAFGSGASNLVGGDTNGSYDIFVRDLRNGTTARVGSQGNSSSDEPSLASGGCAVAFMSFATDLVAGDTNGKIDIFANGADTDGDGLCDEWETNGIDANGDTTIDLPLNLAPFNANPNRKDLFVEIDWMDCTVAGSACAMGDTHNHLPNAAGLQDVVAAFAAAPVTNPVGGNGITLHAMTGEALREIEPIRSFGNPGPGAADDYQDLKLGNPANACGNGPTDGRLGTAADRGSANCANILEARRLSFRYALWAHNFAESVGSSGRAEIGGNDMMVTLGNWRSERLPGNCTNALDDDADGRVNDGCPRQGGGAPNNAENNFFNLCPAGSTVNCGLPAACTEAVGAAVDDDNDGVTNDGCPTFGPPNPTRDEQAATFMHEFGHNLALRHGGDADTNCKPNYLSLMSYSLQFSDIDPTRPLDYSRQQIASLNENGGLSEPAPGINGPAGRQAVYRGGAAIRTNAANGAIDWNANGNTTDVGVTADVNDLGFGGCPPSLNQLLTGFDDWQNIVYSFRGSPEVLDGASAPAPELEPTVDDVVASAQATDADGDGTSNFDDNCPSWPNPGQGLPPWPVPGGDADCDGFISADETAIGTDPGAACGIAGWPADFDDSMLIDIGDVLSLKPGFGGAVPPVAARFDISPSGLIDISDVLSIKPFFGASC